MTHTHRRKYGRLRTGMLLGLGFGIACLHGCTGYQTGALPGNSTPRLYLEPLQNEAYISGFAALFQRELVESLRASTQIQLVSDPDAADYSARIRLRNFRNEAVAYATTDSGRPASARNSIEAWLTLASAGGGPVLVEEDRVTADISVYADAADSFTNPNYQSKPNFARNLAQAVTSRIENLSAP